MEQFIIYKNLINKKGKTMNIKGYIFTRTNHNDDVEIFCGKTNKIYYFDKNKMKIFKRFSDACKFISNMPKDYVNYNYNIKKIMVSIDNI